MKFIKRLLIKLKTPDKPTVVAALVLFAVTLTCTVVMFSLFPYNVFTYVVNAIFAFNLGYLAYLSVLLCTKGRVRIIVWAHRYSFTSKFVDSYDFRTMIFAAGKFVINMAYTVFNGVYGIFFRSRWHISLCIYYLVLCIVRGLLVNRSRKINKAIFTDAEREVQRLRLYRAAGILLLIFTAALDVMVTLMMSDAAYGFSYTAIFVAAIYTVYKVAMSSYNLIKARGSDDCVVRAVRNINFADALVSILALQSAFASRFALNGVTHYGNYALGMLICFLTTMMGLFMIVKAQRALNKLSAGAKRGWKGVKK